MMITMHIVLAILAPHALLAAPGARLMWASSSTVVAGAPSKHGLRPMASAASDGSPVGPATAPVERSGVETPGMPQATANRKVRNERKLTYVMSGTAELRTAVAAWMDDEVAAAAVYGNISTWDTSQVTDMSGLFDGYGAFNAIISSWDGM